MRVLVTGGCGFIGSHLVKRCLADEYEVVVVDDLSTGKREALPEEAALMEADVVSPEAIKQALEGVDAVFHLAAIASVERSKNDWYRAHQVNSGGTVNLLHHIAQSGKKTPLVFASSAAIYGAADALPVTESTPPSPLSAYGADKLANEYHAKVATQTHGIPTLGCRFFNVFGPGQDPSSPYSGVISIFMERVSSGEPIMVLGDGQQTRDFVYVEDVVEALMLGMHALQSGDVTHEVINVGTGLAISIEALAKHVQSAAHADGEIAYGPARDGEVRFSQADVSKARELLKFSAQIPLVEGLRKTYAAHEEASSCV